MLRKRLASAWQTQRLYILLAISIVVFAAVYVLFPDRSSTSGRYPTATPLPTVPPGLTRLTNDLSADTAPAWSPDGTRIVYYSLRNLRQSTLRVMQADGSDSHQIAELPSGPGQVTWLPDEARITFGMGGAVHTVNMDSSQLMQLTNEAYGPVLEFAWSPDARALAFVSDRAGAPDIYLLRFNDPRPLRLTDNHAWTQHLSWSPAEGRGRFILYASSRDGSIAVFTLDVECALERGPDAWCTNRLTLPSTENREPVWSPDGKRIAFTSLRDGNPEIYVMDADGGHQTRLTNSSRVDWLPQWSPSGEYIAFFSSPNLEDGAHNDIYIIRPDGSGLKQLTNDGLANQMAWSPDSRRIAFVTFRDSNLALCAPCNTEIYAVSLE